jgi:hypothetical protein
MAGWLAAHQLEYRGGLADKLFVVRRAASRQFFFLLCLWCGAIQSGRAVVVARPASKTIRLENDLLLLRLLRFLDGGASK